MNSPAQLITSTTLHIKNMVCPRCILVVRERLSQLGLQVLHVDLGYAEIVDTHKLDLQKISKVLEAVGFELIQEKDEVTVENIKIAVINYIQELEAGRQETLSIFLSRYIGINYTSLSRLFSKRKNITIQRYLVLQKIERVKELLDYGDLSLSQIATKLGYSSVHYLSTQFRSIAGLSVTEYKELKRPQRISLDQL